MSFVSEVGLLDIPYLLNTLHQVLRNLWFIYYLSSSFENYWPKNYAYLI